MTLRIVVLVAVFGSSWLIVSLAERRTGRPRSGLEPGLVLVTSHGCVWCGPAREALDLSGVAYQVVDSGDVPELGVKSVPTLLMVDKRGTVVARRSGRSAVMKPEELAVWES